MRNIAAAVQLDLNAVLSVPAFALRRAHHWYMFIQSLLLVVTFAFYGYRLAMVSSVSAREARSSSPTQITVLVSLLRCLLVASQRTFLDVPTGNIVGERTGTVHRSQLICSALRCSAGITVLGPL